VVLFDSTNGAPISSWVSLALHQLLLCTVRTQNVALVSNESLANKRASAHGTDEAIVVPVSILERDEPSAADTSDGFGTCCTSLCKEFSKAISTVWLLIPGGESLSGQAGVTVGATEALPMPGLVAICYTTGLDNLVTLDAPGGKLLLIALCAIDVIVPRNERSRSNGILAHNATETFLMPLMALVLHFLSTSSEDLSASITSRGKSCVITASTIDLLSLRSKWFVYKRHATFCTEETLFMPVLFLIRKILGVDADALRALVAGVGEDLLIATHTIRMLIAKDIPLTSERIVALPATEMS